MRDSQIEIRDFILDWECTTSGITLIGFESLIIALIAGVTKQDLGFGIIAFFVSIFLFAIPLFGGICMLVFSFIWSFILWGIIINYTAPLFAWIICMIAFMILLGVHMAVIDMNEGVFCYSYLLFESLAFVFCIYALKQSLILSIGIFVALVICAFLPIIRHIEGIGLSVCTAIMFYYLANTTLSTVPSIIISGLMFIISEAIYLIMNSRFSWKDIIEESKQKKIDRIENAKFSQIKSELYNKYEELEKDYFYFNKCVCKNNIEKIKFDIDWKNYIYFLNSSCEFIDFNSWYEAEGLYKSQWSDYNSDFAMNYKRQKETEKIMNIVQ